MHFASEMGVDELILFILVVVSTIFNEALVLKVLNALIVKLNGCT